jgi:type IV secretory pathway protease TraF
MAGEAPRWFLFKQVGAVPGDLFCCADSSFTINGVLVGPVYPVDRKGLPLLRLEGCRRAPERHFLPIAERIKIPSMGGTWVP